MEVLIKYRINSLLRADHAIHSLKNWSTSCVFESTNGFVFLWLIDQLGTSVPVNRKLSNFWPNELINVRLQYFINTSIATTVKALLHYAICLAILLRHKLHAKLQGVSCLAINKSRNIFVATTIARSRIRFYFLQRLRQRYNAFLEHCTV
jgi:hypothetical protein